MPFEFLRATNLETPAAGHMRRALYRFVDRDHVTTEWEYVQDGKRSLSEREHFTRKNQMPNYMLLLHHDPGAFPAISPEDAQRITERYVAWGERLRKAGLLADSNKLTDEPGRVMRGAPGQVRTTDGPYSETKEVLGGYFTITAASYDEAVDRARDCPHLEYGGTIEVREVDMMRK